MEKERTVIHLQIGDNHYYYGSVACLFEHHTSAEIGITYGALRNFGLSAEKPYKTHKCIIRKGVLLSKEGNRGIRKRVE